MAVLLADGGEGAGKSLTAASLPNAWLSLKVALYREKFLCLKELLRLLEKEGVGLPRGRPPELLYPLQPQLHPATVTVLGDTPVIELGPSRAQSISCHILREAVTAFLGRLFLWIRPRALSRGCTVKGRAQSQPQRKKDCPVSACHLGANREKARLEMEDQQGMQREEKGGMSCVCCMTWCHVLFFLWKSFVLSLSDVTLPSRHAAPSHTS